MVKLAKIMKGERAADLGMGDGRIAIALAKAGAQVTGFELDDKYIAIATDNIRNENVGNSVEILQLDFWSKDLSDFSIVAIYPMPDIMKDLENKILSELRPGSRVLTNFYPFPTWKQSARENKIYLYSVENK